MPMPAGFDFELLATDRAARRGRLATPHGPVETPAFLPVGTQATVKGLDIGRVAETGAQMVLANTYHLALRPGEDIVAEQGGLHGFMGWDGPILTDSGGFQIFSLADRARVDERGVVFRSHIDGSQVALTPERSIEIQEQLGADLIMQLDHVTPLPSSPELINEATQRSIRWAERCQKAHGRDDQMLLAIVQGGLDPKLRLESARALVAGDFPAYAVGGLSVGESAAEMDATLEACVPALPIDRPRYLMGVGTPRDLLEAIARGIDWFDCVMPTRNGRNALVFTDEGPLRLRNAVHRRDPRPLEADCPCLACRHSRAYLRHLFQAREMLGPILASLHNLSYYQRLVLGARQAIEAAAYEEYRQEKIAKWGEEGR